MLLDAEPALLTLPDHQGTHPSHLTCTQTSLETLKTLLNFNPPKKSPVALDVNARDPVQCTCLHYAVGYNRLEMATVLVASGAQVDSQDSEGKTPMDYAMQLTEGKDEMLAVLRGIRREGREKVLSDMNFIYQGVDADEGGPDQLPNANATTHSAGESAGERKRSKFCNLL